MSTIVFASYPTAMATIRWLTLIINSPPMKIALILSHLFNWVAIRHPIN